ncbi:MAG: GNAT family N-acetyltransferase [Pseudomonadota bacterium]
MTNNETSETRPMVGLTTERLIFRQWRASDFAALAEFFSDETQARFVGGRKRPEEAWRLMATYVGHYDLLGYSYLALETRNRGELVGTVGLWNSDPWPEPELGYWLLPSMQGQGFAIEAGHAVRDFALDELKLATLVSYIDDRNIASVKVAERLGAAYDTTIELLDFGPHQVYRYREA